jgi:integrase
MATPTGKKIKVSGHLEKRISTSSKDKGLFFRMMLAWTDETGKRQRKSITTGLPIKGNKTKAEDMLRDAIKKQEALLSEQPSIEGMLFADLMDEWISSVNPANAPKNKKSIKLTTFGGYEMNVQKAIVPYFRKKGTLLSELSYKDIDAFYDDQMERVKAMTVTKFHANISLALGYAFQKGYIPSYEAIMKKVTRPTPERFTGKFLKESETIELVNTAKGHKLELGVLLGAFYGLRRSEVVGLRWESINFEASAITIEHTVTVASVAGKNVIVADNTTKTKSSYRTLPLIPVIRAKLLEVKAEQERNRELCGKSYNKKESVYIYTDALGNRIKPDYLSGEFPKFLDKHGFKRIRYHDLRHSCASLLLANGVSLKEIQEWLGHSTFKTTADIYAHLDSDSKLSAAAAMSWIKNTSLAQDMEGV